MQNCRAVETLGREIINHEKDVLTWGFTKICSCKKVPVTCFVCLRRRAVNGLSFSETALSQTVCLRVVVVLEPKSSSRYFDLLCHSWFWRTTQCQSTFETWGLHPLGSQLGHLVYSHNNTSWKQCNKNRMLFVCKVIPETPQGDTRQKQCSVSSMVFVQLELRVSSLVRLPFT